MNEPDFDKEIDLHESEWHHKEKREPILGPNGLLFIIMFALSFPVYWIVKTIVVAVQWW